MLSVGVATVQFWPDWTMAAVATLAVFFAGQFIEGNILQPKLVGDSIGVHPVWLMFALLAFGSLFGFVGLLLAVPLAAVLGVLCPFRAAGNISPATSIIAVTPRVQAAARARVDGNV